MMLMMPKSKYLENRIDVKLKTTERERLDSGILTSLISQGPTIFVKPLRSQHFRNLEHWMQ